MVGIQIEAEVVGEAEVGGIVVSLLDLIFSPSFVVVMNFEGFFILDCVKD